MEYEDIHSFASGAAHLAGGWTETILPPDPALGAEFNRVIPPGTWEQFVMGAVTLTTSAVVNNRVILFQYLDQDGNLLYQVFPSLNIPAGSTGSVFFSAGEPASVVNGTFLNAWVNVPNVLLPSQYQIHIKVLLLDAGDQVKNVRLVMRRIPSDVASGKIYQEMLDAWRDHFNMT